VFKSEPDSDEAVEAHRVLASAYLTHGKYKKTLAQVDALLAIRLTDTDASGDLPLLAELALSRDQEVAPRHTTVELQEGGLPFSIQSVQATYWFDTGAELSVMSESEAKRFGLSVHKVEAKVGDLNGTRVDTRIAVADELSIGSVRLKNVAFLVLPDSEPPFNEGSPGSRGLIGIPVLLALERFAWSEDKKFEILPKSSGQTMPHADLCFDGNRPLTQVRYEDRDLAFTLDTGATNTDLYPPFAAAFPDLIRAAVKTDSYKMEGVGGAKYMEAANLKSVKFSIGGFPVTLNSTGVLLKPTTESSRHFAGNLGIDLLQQAHKVTFDFKAMALALQ
jgi:predicted aspartyl protease